jgi:transposase InsO family protein
VNTIAQINQETGTGVGVLCDALLIPRATYYWHNGCKPNKATEPVVEKIPPKNALSAEEKQRVLDTLHSERFLDKTPYDVFHATLDEGQYQCSTRTMYRLLEVQGENRDRRGQRSHRDAVRPELIATRQNEIWSWDITKLRSTQKWTYFHLYVILDIFSRYVVGWLISDRESKELARRLIQQSALKQGIQPNQLTLHSDNGPSMKSHTVAQLLEHLGVAKTHNRPYTSNDNPFSESQFKTMKYCPEFPGEFATLSHGEAFSQRFFPWYNTEHYHSGIAWLTPESVHYGRADSILEKRHEALMDAYLKNPLRFNNKPPKRKTLPATVYINPPQTVQIWTPEKNFNLQKGIVMV